MLKNSTPWISLSILLVMAIILANCKKDEEDDGITLKRVEQFQVMIPELSGLAPYNSLNEFVTISDNKSNVYIISNTGETIKTFDFTGEDLEGVAYDSISSSFFIIEEKKKEVIHLDSNGIEQNRFPININNTDERHGPEGITFNPDNNHIYIVNEKLPSLLIEMTLTGEVVRETTLSFADDYSSIYYDHKDSSLWVLSDESRTLTKCDLFGNPYNTWNTGIDKGEGLIVDSENLMIYIVSDNNSRLYQFIF